MKVDVLFIDAACNKPYTWESHENDSLGGTEACTIRLGEGFAKKGLKVAIVEHFDIPFRTSPSGVNYCGSYWANIIKPKNVIWLRVKGKYEAFPDARHFLWLHDASTVDHNNMSSWVPELLENNVLGICQSDWHVENVSEIAPGIPVKRVYPVLDERCIQKDTEYDPCQLVWLASPHKGLKDGLRVFSRILEKDPSMKLAVFNPGYLEEDQGYHPNVVFLPKKKKETVRQVLSKSLCLFYPTDFKETFGMIAAEANSLGVPVACYPVAGLKESSTGPFVNTEDELIEQVLSWKQKRPVVSGQERFQFENVYREWIKLLNS